MISLFTIEYIVFVLSVCDSMLPSITISPLKSKLPVIPTNSLAITFLSKKLTFLTFKLLFTITSSLTIKSLPIVTLLIFPELPIVILLFTLVNIFFDAVLSEPSMSPNNFILPLKSILPLVSKLPVEQSTKNIVVSLDAFQSYIFKLSLFMVNTLLFVPVVSFPGPT